MENNQLIELLRAIIASIVNKKIPKQVLEKIAKGYSWSIKNVNIENATLGIECDRADENFIIIFEMPNTYDGYDYFTMNASEVLDIYNQEIDGN